MGRTLLCSLAGVVAGFLVGFATARMMAMATAPEARDVTAISFFVGVFLAGCGAITGAIIGGVADLREFFKKKG